MIKHYFGFALFSFIVGTTAVVYAIFNVVNVNEVTVPNYSTYSPAKSCWKMKRESRGSNLSAPTIKQAIFNLKTKQLSWELSAPETNSNIALHFFVKDENGTRYINSMVKQAFRHEYGTTKAVSSYLWLDNLESYENLYVIAEPVSSGAYIDKNFQPKFDQSKAVAVLVY
ncbi:MAG TPA: hypothetical protein VNI60_04790 [Pyrinomonadaceae bacterium]|nr:hypothetical protein [Pyrinomonadaceae bacterium]